VHLTGGILRHFRAFSTPKQNPALEVFSTPAHPQVTLAVSPFLLAEKKDSMSMKMGIQKRQLVILFLVLSLPILLNAIAIQQEIGANGMLQLLGGTYQPSNPNLPLASLVEILRSSLLIIALLGFLCWLVFFISNQVFFQKQHPIAKLIEIVLVVISIAKVFEIAAGVFMPLAWLPQFNDYLLGLPASAFTANWSRWFIFPVTAIILFVALVLSRDKSLEGKNIGETVNAL
jgi:hypothetical protein